MVEQAVSRAQLREKIALAALYAGFFALVFTIAFYSTFPYDRLRDFIAERASTHSDTATSRSVQIGDLQPYGLLGMQLSDVEVTQTTANSTDPPGVMKLSRFSAKISPWALLFGEKKVTLHLAAGGGKLDGKYVESASSQQLDAKLVAFDLGQAGLGSMLGLPVKGKATGTVNLNLVSDVTKSTGSIKLEIRYLRIGDGKAKIKVPGLGNAGLTLDELNGGKLNIAVELHDGVATINRFATDGSDLKLSAKGVVRLSDPFKRSRPDLSVDLAFSDSYNGKSDRTKAMFEIMSMRPEWQRATTPDGTMRVHIGGTVQSLRAAPLR
jgi:type II secretion system protein N